MTQQNHVTRADFIYTPHSCSKVVWAGVVGGILSAMMKSGCEDILPPRLPNVTPPPSSIIGKVWR